MRVLKWMIDRIEGSAQGTEHVFGVSPAYEELNWTGLNFTAEQFKTVTSIDKAAWTAKRTGAARRTVQQLAYHLPKELGDTKAMTLKSACAWPEAMVHMMIQAISRCPSVQVSTTWLAITSRAATTADSNRVAAPRAPLKPLTRWLNVWAACSARTTPGCWSGYSVWTKLVMLFPFQALQATLLCAPSNTRVTTDILQI
jgi:hypothetical protein